MTTNFLELDIEALTFKLAYDQSFGFFNDKPYHEWRLHQEIVSQYHPHKNPKNPLEFAPGRSVTNNTVFNSPAAFYQTNYEPNFSCAFERRVGAGGGNGDGPKWVCDPHRLKRISERRKLKDPESPGCLVYSIGSEGDFQFETGLQELLGDKYDTCEIHIFDMGHYGHKTPKGMNMHYHQWGLVKDGTRKNSRRFKSLSETVKALGHENRETIDIFKIDCERCEWSTWQDWFGPSIPMLQQILIEVHDTPLQHTLPFFDGLMKDRGYVMFHKEPNIQFAGGNCVEFSFLKLHDEFFVNKTAV